MVNGLNRIECAYDVPFENSLSGMLIRILNDQLIIVQYPKVNCKIHYPLEKH